MDDSDIRFIRGAGSRPRAALHLVIDQDAPLPPCEGFAAPQLRLAIDNERRSACGVLARRTPSSGCPKA